MNELLDAELIDKDPYQKIRIVPLIIEWMPIIIGFIAIIFGQSSVLTIAFCTSAFMYTVLPWYFFKSNKYKPFEVIMALFFGNGLSVILLGALFYFQNWEGNELMISVSCVAIFTCIPLALIYIAFKKFISKNTKYEYTYSYSILSRFVFWLIFFFLFNVSDSFYDLFK